MRSPRGNEVPNQFQVIVGDLVYFQSYNSVIACKSLNGITLDRTYWNYSRTTGKYRNMFLGEGVAETLKKIKTGEYKLDDLN